MSSIFLVLLLLLPLVLCQEFPPSEGNFFYTEFLTDDDGTERYVEVMTGIETKNRHKLVVSTQQSELGLFSSSCV